MLCNYFNQIIGISIERQAEMIGRATTELAIHLLGGQHRLNPSNMHQVPTAVFLCGTSLISSYGKCTILVLGGVPDTNCFVIFMIMVLFNFFVI